MYFLSRDTADLEYSSFEEEISRRAKKGDTKSYLYIVPTGAHARELINWVTELSSPNAIALPNILSLSEFISRIARYVRPDVSLLSDPESAVFIELALKDLLKSNALEYFEGSTKPSSKLPIHRGTFEQLVAGIAGLKENGITPEKLTNDINRAELDFERTIADRSALRRAHDVASIYSEYEKRLGGRFTDTYGQYNIVSEHFELSSGARSPGEQMKIKKVMNVLFPEVSDIFIGTFIRLQEPARRIFFALSNVENIRLIFSSDFEKNNESLFALQDKFIRKASEEGLALIIPEQKHMRISSEINAFQINLKRFFYNSSKQPKKTSSIVYAHAARTMKDEIRFTAKKIKELVANGNEPTELSRICIASYRQDDYAMLAREIFREYGIPANITDRARLDRSPLYLAFNALFDLAEFHFNRRSLLRLLSTPYLLITGNNGERIDAPNLYEVITECRLHQGSESWLEEINVYLEQAEEEYSTALDQYDKTESEKKLRKLRQAKKDIEIVERLVLPLRRNKKPVEFYHDLLDIIDECKVVEQLLSASGSMIGADALEFDARSYRAFIELLEELLDVCSRLGFDNNSLPLSFYTERIRVGALRKRFAPRAEPGRGVIVTSFEQTIGYEFDHLFLVGLNDGIFPETFSPSLFNLKEHQVNEDEKIIEQRYLFYQTLCTFRDKLYLVWHTTSDDKKSEIMRSQFVDALEEIVAFSEIYEQKGEIFSSNEFFRYAPRLSDKAFSLAKENGLDKDSLSTLGDHIPHSVSAQKKRSESAFNEFSGVLPLEELTEEEREDLLAFRNRVYSISQLETYAACPFKFFSKYILGLESGLKTDAEEGLTGAERGTILHETLYQLLTGLREGDQDIRTISDEAYGMLTTQITKGHTTSAEHTKHHPFVRLDSEAVFSPPPPGIGMLQKFIDTERKFEKFITKPSFFEATFGLPIAEEKRDKTLYRKEHIEIEGMKFRGKIDRIDMDMDSGIFSVTDYKTRTSATIKDIEEGISLQLPLYLRIAEDLLRAQIGDKEMTGVAGIYHTLLGKESKQQLALGLHEFAGQAFEGHKSGGKNTLIGERETVEDFAAIIEKTVEFAKSYVEGITRGEFPLVKESYAETACRFCDYKKVCRVGEAMENSALRK
jgi:ATP-dependent helicase/nuclease subunit B